jgi:hypothetical protein
VTLIDLSGNIGAGISVGDFIGASASYWSKYGISITASGAGTGAQVTGKVGWKGGGEWEVSTPLVNVNGTWGEFDYQWEPFVPVSF